ncbi:hypothetical protein MLD38_001698 [Melastoma candidum]|uniref:Uncharacterized protein n=1 Tax=Melastoma candidum TaxID=119954 RepID=A0ACB9SFD5_9MYRT|nr:hypothetical protein MLD38_001698 [Melastoma candidum]
MWQDIALQGVILLIAALMFSFIHNVPQSLLRKYRSYRADSNPNVLAKRHFILGAQLLSKARSSSPSSSSPIARSALAEADLSISLNPRDAASHILKSLALDLLDGRENSVAALESLDTALSPPAVRSLGEEERADALVKRAEIRMKLAAMMKSKGSSRKRKGKEEGLEECVADLEESVKIMGKGSARAWRLLGECYEEKGMKDQARAAYESAATAGDSKAAEAAHRLDGVNDGYKES